MMMIRWMDWTRVYENNQNGKVVNLADSFMEFAKMRAPPEIANHSDIAEIPVRF